MTKIDIINTAFTVWGREFYLDTSLSRLAEELKVSKAALYRHFENKQALLNAMTGHFFDDIAAFIRPRVEKAGADGFALIRAVAEYYCRNANFFIFALIRVYDSPQIKNAEKEMASRGVDMLRYSMAKDSASRPRAMRLVFSTITFFMADFYRIGKCLTKPPAENDILSIIGTIVGIIERGCAYDEKLIESLDYKKLENRVTGIADILNEDPVLKAIGTAVAEAGPWETSMEQVARRLGLSKSSLYSHFRNKQDMLRCFFMDEFVRIVEFTDRGMKQSEIPVERFYLGIFSIAAYFRTNPEILSALDWIRTRGLDRKMIMSSKGRRKDNADNGLPPEFLRLFKNVVSVPPRENGDDEGPRRLIHWMMFLVVGTLMRAHLTGKKEKVRNEDIRILFRFITLGIRGFHIK